MLTSVAHFFRISFPETAYNYSATGIEGPLLSPLPMHVCEIITLTQEQSYLYHIRWSLKLEGLSSYMSRQPRLEKCYFGITQLDTANRHWKQQQEQPGGTFNYWGDTAARAYDNTEL